MSRYLHGPKSYDAAHHQCHQTRVQLADSLVQIQIRDSDWTHLLADNQPRFNLYCDVRCIYWSLWCAELLCCGCAMIISATVVCTMFH